MQQDNYNQLSTYFTTRDPNHTERVSNDRVDGVYFSFCEKGLLPGATFFVGLRKDTGEFDIQMLIP